MNTTVQENPVHDKLLRINRVLEYVPVSRADWLAGVKKGKYPAAVKLGARIACWRMSDIQSLIENGIDQEVA